VIPGPDRRSLLKSDTTHKVVGIDYLIVDIGNQTDLYVYFVVPPTVAQQARLTADRVSIVSLLGDAPPVALDGDCDFSLVNGHLAMHVRTVAPGGFTRYRLSIADPVTGGPLMDPYLAGVDFSFKAGCYSDVDCDHSAHACGDRQVVDFPVDYEARDFLSMRTALLDLASQRYPRWADRLEADAAVMLVEVMAALADEMAYHQDRIAREAHLETATQRRSLRRHARLVDYRIHDGLGAATWVNVTAKSPAGRLDAGATVYAVRDGVRVDYSIGHKLDEMLASPPVSYSVDPDRNDTNLVPYQWDADDVCLPVGATSLSLNGGQAVVDALTPFEATPDEPVSGRWVLLRTEPADPGQPRRSQLVRVIKAEKVRDPLVGTDTTLIEWEAAQALTQELDLATLHVHGNVLPVVAGRHVVRTFVIGPDGASMPSEEAIKAAEVAPNPDDDPRDPPEPRDPAWAIERTGPDGSLALLFSLLGTDTDGLVRRAAFDRPGDPRLATPELRLMERIPDGAGGYVDGRRWSPKNSFLDAPASGALDHHFILDDGFWRRIVGFQRQGTEFVHVDHAADAGVTIRFGDGSFGLTPARGTRFRASYLVGNGRRANVPAGAIQYFTQPSHAADLAVKALVSAIENPFPSTSGVDPETPDEVRQLAPEAFRALTFRAVRPEDYAEAAGRLDWVQRAGCSFRWTGSWQTAFVTPDPRSAVEVSAGEWTELDRQLDRFRQAGREASTLNPVYADLDLRISFCVEPTAYAAEVRVRVAAALTGGSTAFFAADSFSFGTALDRSRLEASIQGAGGVRAVESIDFRRRGGSGWARLPMTYQPGRNEVIRVENDPLHPNRGSITLIPDGGA
jgi:hypothetical protein